MTILAPIFAQDSKRIAVRIGNETIDYGRLCADIDSMAHWLFAAGLEPGDRVTIHQRNVANTSYWDWIMHLGAIRAGLVQSTGGIPPQIAQTGAVGPYKAAIGMVDKLHRNANPKLRLKFDPQGSEPLARQLELKKPRRTLDKLEEQAVRLLSTSGTTGTPKVLRWDAALFEARLKQVRDTGDITEDTQAFIALGLITTTGLRYPIAAWQLGASVWLTSFDGGEMRSKEATDSCTFLAASPYRMQRLMRSNPGEWPGKDKRVIELFGGRVPPAMSANALERCGSALFMSYGATEVGRVAAGETSLVERDGGAVGFVEPGITLEIVDREGNPVEAGKAGIVRIKSDFMCEAYVGQAANPGPRASLRGGWFYPGDFGILYEDGLFAIAGRLSDTLNVSGAKMSPAKIEDQLAKMPEIQDACVLSVPMDAADLLTIAFVCDDDVDLGALRNKVSKIMPKAFQFGFIRVGNIPRNGMGRVPRQAYARAIAGRINQMQRLAAEKAGQGKPN